MAPFSGSIRDAQQERDREFVVTFEGDASNVEQDNSIGLCDLLLATITRLIEPGEDDDPTITVMTDKLVPAVSRVAIVNTTKTDTGTEVELVGINNSLGTFDVTLRPRSRLSGMESALKDGVHSASYQIWASSAGHNEDFGQTSAAAAMCGGLAALVVSSNPRLTSREIRHIICSTADASIAPKSVLVEEECDCETVAGFHPHRGFGRIDAFEAVRMAQLYDHPRDLYFESRGGGSSPESEDVWVRRERYSSHSADVFVTSPMFDDHHETLGVGGYVYARVRNRSLTSTRELSLGATIHFYVIATTKDFSTFSWPEHWSHYEDCDGTMERGRSYHFAAVRVEPGIEVDDTRLVEAQWPSWATPAAGDERPRHVLVEVAPHDGRIHGNTVATNDNLARRLIAFERP
ncbi:MAG: hypothetical protein R3F65_06575 [bacterium]